MCISFEEFDAAYRSLTDHDGACRWQYRLFCDLEVGRFPTDVELATGLGKTSIIALWVLALGRTIRHPGSPVPRRLAYVVDRRVVVDQASEFAEDVRTRIEAAVSDATHILHPLASALRDAGCVEGVLETSTLRGQRTLDTRWRDDPSRPAIVVGTVDMVGSRLLFSAYGRVGPWGRSLEAGLLGQDCLIVLDEAHLCSPFAATLAAVERQRNGIAPFAVIRMGATTQPVTDLLARTPGLVAQTEASADDSAGRQPFRLLPEEIGEKKVSDRLNAPKLIEVVESDGNPGNQLAEWAVKKSDEEPGAAIGVVLNTVAEARRCAERLEEKLRERGIPPNEIDFVTITGSMRGWDRDVLMESREYGRFRSRRDRAGAAGRSAFLVATSSIEVGVDIDCDHLGTQACAADSLIQRLGRVNRLGLRKECGSSVLVLGTPDKGTPSGRVFVRLQRLARMGRSSAICTKSVGRRLYRRVAAGLFDVRVPPPALTPSVLDDLAMTSKYPETGSHPDVSRWLHGSVEEASLYIEIAWRAELDWITEVEGAARLLHSFPVSPRETARCPLYEAVKVLAATRGRAAEDPNLAGRIVFFVRDGVPSGQPFRSLPTKEEGLRDLLRSALVVLPGSAGGYDGRFVDPEAEGPVVDVAEEAQSSIRAQRRRLWVRSGQVSLMTDTSVPKDADRSVFIDAETSEEELIAESGSAVRALLGSGWRLIEGAGDGEVGILVAREDRRAVEEAEEDDASLGFREPILLERHLTDAREKARLLCEYLHVPEPVRTAVMEAAGSHDLGKNCPWWQRAVGCFGKPPVAKSGQSRFDHRINRGYRHEVGSVASLERAASIASVDPCVTDLCLHLVAAHHGHARPGFRAEAAGPIFTDALQQVIEAAPARFARVQATHGRWRLAWLESLVKAADVLASRDEDTR
jgi:CRISPR-associated endonuclease/helicase Cas3